MDEIDTELPLHTERLLLRRVHGGDSAAMLAIYGNETAARYQFWPAWSAEQVNHYLHAQSSILLGDPGVPFALGVIEKQSEMFIGSIQLTINSIEDYQGEVGFSFHPDFGGRGFATEAVNAALGYAYSKMELHRIFAAVDTRNERSWRLMERIGMRREAHFIHADLDGDQWIDEYTYAMLDDEWLTRNPA